MVITIDNVCRLLLPWHKGEYTPAEVFTGVGGVAHRFCGQLGANLWGQLVVGVGCEPPAHGEPFGRLVSVPTVLVGEHHFNDVAAEVAEGGEQVWQQEKIGDGMGVAALGHLFRWR